MFSSPCNHRLSLSFYQDCAYLKQMTIPPYSFKERLYSALCFIKKTELYTFRSVNRCSHNHNRLITRTLFMSRTYTYRRFLKMYSPINFILRNSFYVLLFFLSPNHSGLLWYLQNKNLRYFHRPTNRNLLKIIPHW